MKPGTIPAAHLTELRARLEEDAGPERLSRAIELLRDLDARLDDRRALATFRRELDAFRTITEAAVRGRSAPRPDERTLRAFGFDLSRRLQAFADAFHEASHLVDSLAGHAPFEPGERDSGESPHRKDDGTHSSPPMALVETGVPQATAKPTSLPRGRGGESAGGSTEERHPKKKRSYSVDMGVCDDLELIAWYQRRSSSSIVEELMKKYVAGHREMLEKARAVHVAR